MAADSAVTFSVAPGSGSAQIAHLILSKDGQAHVKLDDGKGGTVNGVKLGAIKVSHTGTLFVTGTGKADNIDLTIVRGRLAFNPYYSFVTTTQPGSVMNQLLTIGPRTGNTIKRAVVNGLGGDDKIIIRSDVDVTVRGGKGNDLIGVKAPTSDVVGGSGDDIISPFLLPSDDAVSLNIYHETEVAADILP